MHSGISVRSILLRVRQLESYDAGIRGEPSSGSYDAERRRFSDNCGRVFVAISRRKNTNLRLLMAVRRVQGVTKHN